MLSSFEQQQIEVPVTIQFCLLGRPLQHDFIRTTHIPHGVCTGQWLSLLKHAALRHFHLNVIITFDIMSKYVRAVTKVHFNSMSDLSGHVPLVVKDGQVLLFNVSCRTNAYLGTRFAADVNNLQIYFVGHVRSLQASWAASFWGFVGTHLNAYLTSYEARLFCYTFCWLDKSVKVGSCILYCTAWSVTVKQLQEHTASTKARLNITSANPGGESHKRSVYFTLPVPRVMPRPAMSRQACPRSIQKDNQTSQYHG